MLGLVVWVLAARADGLQRTAVSTHSGFSVVVPSHVNGQLNGVRLGFSVPTSPLVRVGLRGEVGLSPGVAELNEDGAVWSAAVECRARLGVSPQADPFAIVAAGFVASDRRTGDAPNLVLPYGQLGVGIRLGLISGKNANLYFEPDISIIPGILYDMGPLSVAAPMASGVLTVSWGDQAP